MEEPKNKEQLLYAIRQERAAWAALVTEVGADRMELPELGGNWSFKDVAAHLNAWRKRGIVRLQSAAAGVTPPPPPWAHIPLVDDNFDPINQWIYNANHDRPAVEILNESNETLQQLEEAVKLTPEQDLFDPNRFDWTRGTPLSDFIMGNSAGHFFEDHEPEIRAWLVEMAVR